MSDHPEVGIVVLNWNGLDDTRQCIHSLLNINYENYFIVVVDNNSATDDLKSLNEEFQDSIASIQNDANLGFGGGNNVGMRWSIENRNPKYILTLNNDTVVEKSFLSELVKTMEDEQTGENIAAAGPVILDNNDREKVWSGGTNYEDFLHPTAVLHRRKSADNIPEEPWAPDGIVGCAVLYNVDCLIEVGLIDEGYFLGYEEHDWCFRARERGYRFLIVPSSRVYHEISSSRGRNNPLYEYYASRNRLLFYQKNYPLSKRAVAVLLMSMRLTLASLTLALRDIEMAKAGMQGIFDGITHRPPRKIP